MKILAIEISSPAGSVAVAEGGRVVAEVRFGAPRGRGAEVFSAIEELRPRWEGLARIAVGIGPGSYNGLRVACAIAGSFRMALGAEVVAAPSPCLLEVDAPHYFAAGDARGGLAYLAEVRGRKLLGEILLLPRSEIGARKISPAFRVGPIEGAEFLAEARPSAAALALLAPSLAPLRPEQIEPIYLKPPHITEPRAKTG